MDDFDDFGVGGEAEVNNNNNEGGSTSGDYLVDQRATDRLMSEIGSNGFRDGYQSQFESEPLMQRGFDAAYTRLAQVSFLVGQIRALAAHSRADSAFLARLSDKLERIEKNSYELLLDWRPGDESATDVDETKLLTAASEHQTRLAAFKDLLLARLKTPTPPSVSLADLEAIKTNEDEPDEGAAHLDPLNSLLESWNI